MATPISIIITTYNREHYLSAAIESILAQTRCDFELLIWDDGSKADCVEIARNYAKRNSKVRVIAAEHQGRAPSLKAAIAQTTGTYVGWVDSDDLLDSKALEETAAVLDAHSDVGLVYTDYVVIDKSGKVTGEGQRCRIPYSKERLLLNFMTFHFRLIRRSVFDQVGGIDESLAYAEDYDLCLRLSEVTEVRRVRKPLYYYRNHLESISHRFRVEQIHDSNKAMMRAVKRRGQNNWSQFYFKADKSLIQSAARSISPLLVALPLAGAVNLEQAQTQVIVPAGDGTNTVVTPDGSRLDISGGQLSGDRANLFHSFAEFGLSQNQIANFLSNPQIRNILARVVGGDASLINGLIQVSGGNANLFLMNPAGIVFGPNASLNVPAAFTATTATGIGIDSNWFNGTGANNYAALIGTPSTFATTTQPGGIINAGNLSVSQGQNLTMLGGTVISNGQLSAPGGQITVAAVPGESMVRISQEGHLLSLDIQPIVPNSSQPENSSLPSAISLPELLTGGGWSNATEVALNSNGEVVLSGSGLKVEAGDVVAREVTAQTVTLSANHNLTLVPGAQLRTSGNLNLLAQDTVRVRDSVTNPFLAQTGGNLYVQGNQGIDILALNHPETPFQSGGNLSLVSDGNISGDARFASSGSFSILNLASGPGKFVSLYDPIISANGDVTFGDYTGAALKVEATGSIISGNITTTSPDFTALPTSDPDFTTLTTTPALILRAGLTTLANAPTTFPFTDPDSGTNFESPGGSSVGSITVGNIDTTTDGEFNSGPVILEAIGGSITTGAINSSSSFGDGTTVGGSITLTAGGDVATGVINSFVIDPYGSEGGDVTLIAGGNITTDTIDSSATSDSAFSFASAPAVGGLVSLNAGGDIVFGSINIQGSNPGLIVDDGGPIVIFPPNGTGGDVQITANGVVRGVGLVGESPDTILSAGSSQGGSVTIQHDGDITNSPFIVGDLTIAPTSGNGTVGTINTGSETITAQSFPTPGTVTSPGGSVNITFANTAPTLTVNSSLTGAQQDQPFTFTFADLAPVVADENGDNTSITIDSIAPGATLRINGGEPVVPGPEVVLSDGDSLEYTPPPGFNGQINAFTITANDVVSFSAPIQVAIDVAPTPEDPVIEDPVIEDPVIEDPVIEDPVVEDPVVEDPVVEDPVVEDPVVEDPVIEESAVLIRPQPPGQPQISTQPNNPNLRSTVIVDAVTPEVAFTGEFESYLGLPSSTSLKSQEDEREIAHKIEEETGAKPAFIYVSFVPPQIAPDVLSDGTQLLQKANKIGEKDSDQLELVVLTAQGNPIRKRISEATRSQVLEVAQQLRRQITDPRKLGSTSYLASSQQLYRWLVAPLEADLQTRGISNLVFLLDAGLRSTPVAALHDGQAFLVERYSIGLMPSLSLTDTRYADIKNSQVLAMGISETTQGQDPLPAVPFELATLVKQLWPGSEFLNQAFTRENFKQIRRRQPFGIIHFATHANIGSGATSDSYIQLWDDKLQLDQIRQLELNAPQVEMLVLSACKTALGNQEAELGFAGLAVQAGVKTTVASLWFVDDTATAGLMTQFYKHLKTAPIKAEALRQAQIAMAKGQVYVENGQLRGLGLVAGLALPAPSVNLPDQKFSHPYFWSGFTMVGNPW